MLVNNSSPTEEANARIDKIYLSTYDTQGHENIIVVPAGVDFLVVEGMRCVLEGWSHMDQLAMAAGAADIMDAVGQHIYQENEPQVDRHRSAPTKASPVETAPPVETCLAPPRDGYWGKHFRM